MWRIPLSDLDYDEAEEQAVLEVVRSKWLSMGPRTEEFEARAAEYLGVKHAIAVANCTCALEMAFQQLGRGAEPPDPQRSRPPRALVPDLTFVATANAALLSGYDVEFADIGGVRAPTLSAEAVAQRTSSAEPGSVLTVLAPVHYAGFDAGIEQIAAAARAAGVRVVEDAAHAIGARSSSGRMLGTVGDIGCYSFFANKNLSTGEGGLVVTQDDDLAAGLRLLRSHGMTSLTWKRHSTRGHGYDVLVPGHNYRITEITAALALVQLSKLDAGNARRRRLYALYRDLFEEDDRLVVPFGTDEEAFQRSACHIFPLLCPDAEARDQIRDALSEAGIQTSHHYPPVSSFSFYRSMGEERGQTRPDTAAVAPSRHQSPCPAAAAFAAREITLPLYPNLKEVEVEEVAAVVLRTLRRFRPS